MLNLFEKYVRWIVENNETPPTTHKSRLESIASAHKKLHNYYGKKASDYEGRLGHAEALRKAAFHEMMHNGTKEAADAAPRSDEGLSKRDINSSIEGWHDSREQLRSIK